MNKIRQALILLLLLSITSIGFSQVRLSDLNVKGSVSGTEKIPVSGSGNPAITPNLLLSFIVQDNITNGELTAPSENAVAEALALKTTTALTASTGTTVAFDLPRLYGTDTSPVTGNITMNSTGAIVGMVQTMIHNDSSEPTFGSEFHVSGTYTTGVDNLIMFLCTGTGDVWVTITKAN